MAMGRNQRYRTWIEVSERALHENVEQFFQLIGEQVRFMAVVKSNAYGHGLIPTAECIARIPQFQQRGWFGVDSIVEALALRNAGISHPILVLGYTLPARLKEAAHERITVSVATFEALSAVAASDMRPDFHLKLDTGMHRQGFLSSDIDLLIAKLNELTLRPLGCFTHFAAAKDPSSLTFTMCQLDEFLKGVGALEEAGYGGMLRHAAASGGTLLSPATHLDMVRIGMGMYGYWPSKEFESGRADVLRPRPALSWKTIISEVKDIPAGSYIGYDRTERVERDTRMAVLPIGYWHGYDRGFSGIGKVLVRGREAKVLGRISMDMTVVDISDIPGVVFGDEAVIIGDAGTERISAAHTAEQIGTTAYELLTRINPLIKRIVV